MTHGTEIWIPSWISVGADAVTIHIDREGAEYIADVMEQYQHSDAGARQIAEHIRAAFLEDTDDNDLADLV